MNKIKLMSPSQGMKGRPAEKQNPESEGYDNCIRWSPGKQPLGGSNKEKRDVSTDVEQK